MAYAQAAGADHLLQSKRARLFTQLAVGEPGGALWPYEQEEALFAVLRRKVARDDAFATRDYTLPPSVVPMLMLGSNPPTNPAELYERTRELRESDVGSAYRAWHTEVRAAWARGEGHEAAEALVAEVAEEVAGRLGPAQAGRATGVNLEMRELPDAAERTSRLRNWFVERIRFRGHRKLLLRMSLPQVTFDELAARLREIWDNG